MSELDEKPQKARKSHRPSTARYGLFLSSFLVACIAWLLTYTLLDWDWQQSLGGWNYLIAALLGTVFSQGLQHWHTGDG